jgi:hypothetical protein
LINVPIGDISLENNEALMTYQSIAEALKNDESVERMDRILEQMVFKYDHIPFMFLEGSSGSGKTQMAFNIMARRTDMVCFYFLFSKPTQRIYSNFSGISALFLGCLEKDADHYSESISPNDFYLSSVELYVFGFIFELLCKSNGTNIVRVSPKRASQVAELLIKRNQIFLIDECIAITDESKTKIRFVKNCFRTLGLRLILLGTDSRASEIGRTISSSSRCDSSIHWCYIISDFPKVKVELLGLPEQTPTWLVQTLSNSRPWFSQLVSRYWEEESCFESCLHKAFKDVSGGKKVFENELGRVGQIKLFHEGHYYNSTNGNTGLIHYHFAQLFEEKYITLTLANTWEPSSKFPNIEEDVLLYLILMGGKGFSAFYLEDKPVPYHYYFDQCLLKNMYRNAYTVNFGKTNQPSNNGLFLEALMCSTVCLASHSQGVSGVTLNLFIKNVVFQLQRKPIKEENVRIQGLEKIDFMMNFVVPFLSPTNLEWPHYLCEIPDSNFGNMKRPEDREQIDFSTDCGIYGEAKDHQSPISLPVMRNILKRIKKDAKLQLVYVQELQGSYYYAQNTLFEKEFSESYAFNKVYFKIDARQSETSLETINGLPFQNENADGLVLFIMYQAIQEENENIMAKTGQDILEKKKHYIGEMDREYLDKKEHLIAEMDREYLDKKKTLMIDTNRDALEKNIPVATSSKNVTKKRRIDD